MNNNYCEPDTVEHCGAELQVCNTEIGEYCIHGECVNPSNCKSNDECMARDQNFAAAECNDEGQCIVTACKEGMHVYNNYCEPDTIEHCGVERQVCDTISGELCIQGECVNPSNCKSDAECMARDQNYASAVCTTEGECIVTACKDGMHVYENRCEVDNIAHCGVERVQCNQENNETCLNGHCVPQPECFSGGNCIPKYPNFETAECIEGKCYATSCVTGTHLIDRRCDLDTNDYCGNDQHVCDSNNLEFCMNGECTSSCNDNQSVCMTNLEMLACINNDQPHYCGCTSESTGIDCTILANITSGATCENSKCQFQCQYGYGDCNKNASDGCEISLFNNIQNCGQCGRKCPDYKNATTSCVNQSCTFNCINNNYSKCNDGCFNLNNTPNHCGNCDESCKEPLEFSTISYNQSCYNGQCRLCGPGQTACFDKYCADLTGDDNNCGECGYQCGSDQACQNGKCIVTACNEGKVHVNVKLRDGNIEEIDATCISNEKDFCAAIINSEINSENKGNYIQMNDFTINSDTISQDICKDYLSSSGSFGGIYLGNGKTITVNIPSGSSLRTQTSLFSELKEKSVIENLTLNIINFNTQAESDVGSLASSATDALIRNVTVNSDITATNSKQVGGLIGTMSNTEVINSSVSGTVRGNIQVGGLTGTADKNSSIINSTTNVTLYARANAAGLIANIVDSNIDTCHSTVTISPYTDDPEHNYVGGILGGLVGTAKSGNNSIISNSSASGSIQCTDVCGGLIGSTIGYGVYNSTSNTTFSVSSEIVEKSMIGGLLGITENSTIANSQVSLNHNLTSSSNYFTFGGLIGTANESTIENCSTHGNISISNTNTNQIESIVGGLIGRANSSSVTHSKYTTSSSDKLQNLATSENIVSGGLIGDLSASKLINNFVQADMTCKLSTHSICGGLAGSVNNNSQLAGNYIINTTTLKNDQNNTTTFQNQNFDIPYPTGGFIGHLENSYISNNYSVNFGLPYLIGKTNTKSPNIINNYWYNSYNNIPCSKLICDNCHKICQAGSFAPAFLQIESYPIVLKENLVLAEPGYLLFEIINKKYKIDFKPFALAQCSNIFTNYYYSEIPVISELLPEGYSCTIIKD